MSELFARCGDQMPPWMPFVVFGVVLLLHLL
jgi:hypothetical protein